MDMSHRFKAIDLAPAIAGGGVAGGRAIVMTHGMGCRPVRGRQILWQRIGMGHKAGIDIRVAPRRLGCS